MNMFSFFRQLNLTHDQQSSLEKLETFLNGDERAFILQGYAGSGKTTLLKGVVQYLNSLQKRYQLMAPTGRAAKVINQKTGFESTTIHKGIYSFAELQEIEKVDEEDGVNFLYQYKIRNNPEVHNSILIIDEASMVSDVLSEGEFFRFGSGHLLKDLISYSRINEDGTTSKIIFIGDPAQLPPVGMNFSPALDRKYLEQTYRLNTVLAEMKEVRRQSIDNGILKAATKIRTCLTSGYFNDFDLRENGNDIFNPPFQDYLGIYKAQEEQKIIICYKNKTALDLNIAIRKDKFGDDLPIQPSDTVIIGGNNYRLGVMNGEFAIVSEASPSVESREITFREKGGKVRSVRLIWRAITLVLPDEKGQPKSISGQTLENYLYGDNYLKPEEYKALYVDFKNRHKDLKKGTEEFKQAISSDKYFNCLLLKYGYAVTCHKAQGGEWANAFVFWDRGVKQGFNFLQSEHDNVGKSNADFYRWAYTAVTRASRKLFCINPPCFSSFSSMNFIDISVQRAFNELAGKVIEGIEVEPTNELIELLERYSLINAPLPLQDHFIHNWYHLRGKYIDIHGYERKGFEIRYLFKRDTETAGIKYSVNGKNEVNKTYLAKLPSYTTSDELFETITSVLSNAPSLVVKRSTSETVMTKVEFEWSIEESKQFLKDLFNSIKGLLVPGASITDIEHLQYKDRYTFEKDQKECVIDFEYDQEGFFGRVVPIERRCHHPELLIQIQEIVSNLKQAKHVL